jgi:hypothetical protein
MEPDFISHKITLEKGLDSLLSPVSSIFMLKAVESSASSQVFEELGLRVVEGGYVKWQEDALLHPRNWSASRKAFDISLVLLLDLFT